jgi:hypothetical protein
LHEPEQRQNGRNFRAVKRRSGIAYYNAMSFKRK